MVFPKAALACGERGKEQRLVSKLREREEEKLLREWAMSTPLEQLERAAIEYKDLHKERPLEPLKSEGADVMRIGSDVIKEVLGELDSEANDIERLTKRIEDLYLLNKAESRVYYCNLTPAYHQKEIRNLEEFLKAHQESIEKKIIDRLGLEDQEREFRVGMAESRFYIWIRNNTHKDIMNAWSTSYYYPKDEREFSRLSRRTLENLGFNPESEASRLAYNELLDWILSRTDDEKIRESRHLHDSRIQGEALRFQMDVNGLSVRFLDGKVERITGINGQGGIEAPKFLRGEEFEIARARLMVSVLSDGHITEDSKLEYYDETLDRAERFSKTLQKFGNVAHTIAYREGKGEYRVHVSTVLGRMLESWGIPQGDRTVQNPELSSFVVNGSIGVRKAYLEDLIPEEGCFHSRGTFAWNRSHALRAGKGKEQYMQEPAVSSKAIGLLKNHGKEDTRCKYLSWSDLRRMKESNDANISIPASELIDAVKSEPNRLLEGEKRLAESLGIRIYRRPISVRFMEKTRRITVCYDARTKSVDDAERWACLCPPNDKRKRDAVNEWLDARR